MTDITDKSKQFDIPEYVYNEYSLAGEELYYVKELKNGGSLVRRNIATGEETTIGEGDIGYITIKDDTMFFYDKGSGLMKKELTSSKAPRKTGLILNDNDDVLSVEPHQGKLLVQTMDCGIMQYDEKTDGIKRIVNNGNLSNGNNDGTLTMKIKDDEMYYYDSLSDVYRINMKTGEKKKIVDWRKVNFVKAYRNDMKNAAVRISWGTDYIMTQVGYYDEKTEKWSAGIVAFDYSGKVIYSEQRNRMDVSVACGE